MAVNSFRIVKSFQIFENQPVCLLVITNFKAIEPFTFDNGMILSILVDTFISKISLTMQPGPKIDSISGA